MPQNNPKPIPQSGERSGGGRGEKEGVTAAVRGCLGAVGRRETMSGVKRARNRRAASAAALLACSMPVTRFNRNGCSALRTMACSARSRPHKPSVQPCRQGPAHAAAGVRRRRAGRAARRRVRTAAPAVACRGVPCRRGRAPPAAAGRSRAEHERVGADLRPAPAAAAVPAARRGRALRGAARARSWALIPAAAAGGARPFPFPHPCAVRTSA